MKSVMKRVFYVLCAIVVLFTTDNYVLASTVETYTRVKEDRGQIDFDHINIGVLNNNEILYSAMVENGRESSKGKDECNELNRLINVVPEVKDYILEYLNNGINMYAIGYTTVYLTENDEGQLVPIIEEETSNNSFLSIIAPAKTGESSHKYTCTSLTMVGVSSIPGSSNNSYTTTSYISWSKPAFIGGEKYHGSGTDFLLQACPNTFTIESDEAKIGYWSTEDHGKTWEIIQDNYGAWEGEFYWRENGGNSYIRYGVEDEPYHDILGGFAWALRDFQVTAETTAPGTSNIRKINTYYIHSWDSIDIDVSITVNTSKEVALNIRPSIQGKSWQVYSYVTFNY